MRVAHLYLVLFAISDPYWRLFNLALYMCLAAKRNSTARVGVSPQGLFFTLWTVVNPTSPNSSLENPVNISASIITPTLHFRQLGERLTGPVGYACGDCSFGKVIAVAGACAANVLAVAIPCHRVVRQNVDMSGYRWGMERKRRLLQREADV
jgi:hypothetical protein